MLSVFQIWYRKEITMTANNAVEAPVLNVERFLRLADVIEIEHKLFNMSRWCNGPNEEEELSGEPFCGTSGCLAGFVVAEFAAPLWDTYAEAFTKLTQNGELVPDNGHISDAAQELLGLTDPQADQLFHIEHWPYKYQQAYVYAPNSNKRAKVSASYLRDIASGKEILE
jgi:hypothetical protein